MIGTAAGLALTGKIPFACSFGCFLTGRYDQIRMSVAYNRANVKLVGTHSGVAIGEDGHSQMGLEDVALLRSLPDFAIYQPCDDQETRAMLRYMVANEGPVYFRLTRQKLANVFTAPFEFKPGKWNQITKGKSIALIGSGGMTSILQSANEKMGQGYSLINAGSLKPIDRNLILDIADSHDWIVTAEDHYTIGGLGSAVAEVMAEANTKAKLYRIGVETFGESGSPEQVLKHFELDVEGIVHRLQRLLAKKAA